MKIFTAFALTVLFASPLAAQTPAAAAAPADVLGTWDATFNTAQGQIPAQLKLKKEGAKIIGTIASQMGESPVEAEVKDKTLSVWFNFQGQSGAVEVEMVGTVDGDSAKGSMSAGGQAAGDWSATRAKEQTPAKPAAAPPEPPKEQPAAKADLTGTWNVSVELPSMTANPTIVLKQDGEKLTGDYISAQYGKYSITGTVKGAEVNFSFSMNVEGTALNVGYTGTVDKDGNLAGSVNYGDMMSGTFVATKKK